jgi:hypothetical protein
VPSTEDDHVQGDHGRPADDTAEQQRQVDEAVEQLRRAFRTDPDPAEVRHHLAVVRNLEGEGEAVVDLTAGEPVLDLTADPGEPPEQDEADRA